MERSTIDRLPAWADGAKQWAFGALMEGKLARPDILREFNARLRAAAVAAGVDDPPQISRAAIERLAERIAVLGRRLEETREIAVVLAPKLDRAGGQAEGAGAPPSVPEIMKTLVHAMLVDGQSETDGVTAGMLVQLTAALAEAEKPVRIEGV